MGGEGGRGKAGGGRREGGRGEWGTTGCDGVCGVFGGLGFGCVRMCDYAICDRDCAKVYVGVGFPCARVWVNICFYRKTDHPSSLITPPRCAPPSAVPDPTPTEKSAFRRKGSGLRRSCSTRPSSGSSTEGCTSVCPTRFSRRIWTCEKTSLHTSSSPGGRQCASENAGEGGAGGERKGEEDRETAEGEGRGRGWQRARQRRRNGGSRIRERGAERHPATPFTNPCAEHVRMCTFNTVPHS